MEISNRKEKEEKVIDLYLENKTVREIAKIIHMSFSDIGKIIRKYNERKARENLESDPILSEETKAIELYSRGKTPIEVKILLNISSEKAEIYYKAYWKLNGLHKLYEYYETEIKDDLPSFLKLYSKARELGISNAQVVLALRYSISIPSLKFKFNLLYNEIEELETKKAYLNSEITDLEFSINKFRNSFGRI